MKEFSEVYIPKGDMPNNCAECQFFDSWSDSPNCWCNAKRGLLLLKVYEKIEVCPLKELNINNKEIK